MVSSTHAFILRFRSPERHAVWLVDLAGDLGKQSVCGEADGADDLIADVLADRPLWRPKLTTLPDLAGKVLTMGGWAVMVTVYPMHGIRWAAARPCEMLEKRNELLIPFLDDGAKRRMHVILGGQRGRYG